MLETWTENMEMKAMKYSSDIGEGDVQRERLNKLQFAGNIAFVVGVV